MFAEPLLTFSSVWAGWATLALAAIAAAIALTRRPVAPRLTYIAVGLGLGLLAFAASQPVWQRATPQQVVVMVDLSPSTRTADYRDRTVLEHRIDELLHDTPYRLQFFAGQTQDVDPALRRLPDLPADHTTYAPPAAAAVVLFSDCRFSLPEQSPPTYVIVDSGLEDPEDAAVTDLEIRGNRAAVSVNNSGSTRRLVVGSVTSKSPSTVPTGSTVVSCPLAPQASKISAELAPGDTWPENDMLTATAPPPGQYEQWWVGRSNPGAGWRAFGPQQLPTDSAAYLAPGVIVLDDLAASDLSDLQQQRLRQYVRDLGGGVVLLGGEHAFAAGGYEGSVFDSISPLASNPPTPTNHWILLVDASGSMSSAAAGATRWKFVTDAVAQLLPHLPPEDVASVGSFAQTLQWWIDAKPVRDAESTPLSSANVYPHGPTNLQPALETIARSADGKMPVQLLVLSDFDTQVTNVQALSALLKSKNIRLHLLAIGQGTALPALRQVCAATDGTVATQLDPTLWGASAQQLAQAAGPALLERNPVTVRSISDGAGLDPQTATPWNRVWLKDSATELAEARQGAERLPMAARWNVGEGRVLAEAFDVPPPQVDRLAALVSRSPHDPRFHLTWKTGSTLRVVVDAANDGKYLNNQSLTLDLTDPSMPPTAALAKPIPQTGPGRYEVAMPAPRSPGMATVRAGRQVIGRVAVPGRYAPEFDAVGNDHAAMRELARRSGGQLVPPDRTTPLEIRWPRRPVPLTSPLAAAGALCLILGLVWWRSSRGQGEGAKG